MANLVVSIIQSHLYWESIDQNLQAFETKINAISEETDVVVLPEMFTTGFTMNPFIYAENHDGKGLQWMKKMARQKNSAIVGSISVKENNQFFNRLYWVFPDQTVEFYNKRHLFSMGNEPKHYNGGNKKLIIEYKGWKICPLVCYDLRFPVWSRNTKQQPYDVLIYVANWPAARSYPWKQLLIARAIENQCFVLGVNRVGDDGNAVSHSGDSMAMNARGEILTKIKPNEETIETVVLLKNELTDFRISFPVLNDGDDFTIT
jgi:predicted amidohydrolase